MLEIKTKLPHLMIEVLGRGAFPPEHVAQCQGALWVAEREWIDIAVYWPRMPRFVKRTTRDEAYIKKRTGRASPHFVQQAAAATVIGAVPRGFPSKRPLAAARRGRLGIAPRFGRHQPVPMRPRPG